MTTWYKRPKLVLDMFRNLALDAMHLVITPQPQAPIYKYQEVVDRVARRLFKTVLFSGSALIFYSYNVETNPYSYRDHFVLVPRYLENKLGEYKIEKITNEFKEDVLPREHPQTARVRSIAKDMIESRILNPMLSNRDPLAEQSTEYLNWEVIVIDRPIVKACCYAGKIVIFTGLLDRLNSDAEIATVIGHEIGHDFARHAAEKITQLPRIAFHRLIWYLFFHEDESFKLPGFRKIEREADYIGALLMASAGYDPSVAPTVYKRLSEDMVVSDNCSILPTGRKRAVLLSRPEIMDKLMSYYRKSAGSSSVKN